MTIDLLSIGIYPVPEVSKYLSVSEAKVRGWVYGYPRSGAPPLINNQLDNKDYRQALSFVNLMEARFISVFAAHGVHVRTIRAIAEEASDLVGHPHPFATKTLFRTDGKKILAEIAQRGGDKQLYDLQAKNWAFYDILKTGLLEGVDFDPVGIAGAWRPRRSTAPHVVLNPKMAFGQPVLIDCGVPTSALFDAFHANGETYESVAKWYEVPIDQVKEAVRFEFDVNPRRRESSV